MEFDEDWLTNQFKEFKKINHLLTSGCKEIPENKGIYIVVRESIEPPEFTKENEKLKKIWIENTKIIYIGQTEGNLRTRAKRYILKKISHSGGNKIWNLKDFEELKIYWKVCSEPKKEESELLKKFIVQFGDLPFANMKYEKYISGEEDENS